MMHKKLFLFIIILSLVFHCKSAAIKDEKSLEKTRDQALKGDQKSYESYREALETPGKDQTEEEHQELKEKIL
jgi:type II restriction/modification system DNA methylase subunit YeeA